MRDSSLQGGGWYVFFKDVDGVRKAMALPRSAAGAREKEGWQIHEGKEMTETEAKGWAGILHGRRVSKEVKRERRGG